MGVIALVIITMIAIQIIPSSPDEDPDGWQYDEYRNIPDATAATGALEMSTVGGIQYVHAKGIGTGKITMADGSIETIQVAKAHLDICLMLGQSNAGYANVNLDEAPAPLPGTAYYYGASSGSYNRIGFASASIHSMTSADGTAATGDKAPSFAKKYYEITGHRVYWVCGAVDGVSIKTFDPDGGTSWEYAKEVLKYAIRALDPAYYTYDSIGWMWIQGEADRNMDINEYKTRFLALDDAIMDGDLGEPFHHVFISKVKTNASGSAQVQLAAEYPDIITMATTIADTFTIDNGLMGSDDLHYTQAGDNLIGEALGLSMGQWALDHPADDSPSMIWKIIDIMPLLIVVAAIMVVISSILIRRI